MKKLIVVLGILCIALFISTIILAYLYYQADASSKSAHESMRQTSSQIDEYKNMIKELENEIEELKKQNDSEDSNTDPNSNINNNYEIMNEPPQDISFDDKNRGTEVIEYNNEYYVIIKMGEKNSGGYSIKVTDVKIDKPNVTIHVKENEPPEGSMVTMAFTYPYTVVKFDFKPNVDVIYD